MTKSIYITFDYRDNFVTITGDTYNSKEQIKSQGFMRAPKVSKRYKEISSKEEGVKLCDTVAQEFNVNCEEKKIINTENYYYQAKVDTSVKKTYNNNYKKNNSWEEVDSYYHALETA